MSAPILELVGVRKTYRVKGPGRPRLTALAGATLAIHPGETVAVVGESGSGKSTLGRIAMRLIAPDAGKVVFRGEDISRSSAGALKSDFRRAVSLVFQNPGTSLSPHLTVSDIVSEPLRIHGVRDGVEERTRAALRDVGLGAEVEDRYPDQLSGGQRQRVGIARALMLDPQLVVADEPTASLDVSIQAQIINLLADLRSRRRLAMLFITHDLHLAHFFADRVAVMYLGEIVEVGPPEILTELAQHPYTAMLASMLGEPEHRLIPAGVPPSPIDRPVGCAFASRCPLATELCLTTAPTLTPRGSGSVACHRPGELVLVPDARRAEA